MKKQCDTCQSWCPNGNSESCSRLHKNFGFCSGIEIHEGEMYDAEYETNIPSEDINIVINTSEWFQNFQTHKNFGCNKWEEI